jgi:O-antigen ligase
MIRNEKPWWLSIDRWALALFVCATVVVNGKNVLRIVGIGMALAFMFKYAKSRATMKWTSHPPEVLAYTTWGIWTGLSGLVVCTYYDFFLTNYLLLLQMIAMIWLVYGLLRFKMSDRLVYWAFIVGCLVQLLALKMGYSFERYTGIVEGAEQMGEARITGLTGNANSLGFIMITGVCCAMLLWRMKKSPINYIPKALLVAFVVVAVYVTFQTGSRKTSTAMTILIVVWVIWLLPQGKGVITLIWRASAGIVILIIGWSLLTLVLDETMVGKRFNELIDRGNGSLVLGVDEDIRIDMYRAGWRMFTEHPVAGVGLGHYQVFYWKGAYSHSDYIEPLACTGLVGFMIYHCFSILLARRILRLRKRVRDQNEKYKLDVMLLVLVTGWLLGFGAPYWSIQRHFVLVTTFAAYTWMLERRLKGMNDVPDAWGMYESGGSRVLKNRPT